MGIASIGRGGIVCADEPQLAWAEEVFGPVGTASRDQLFTPMNTGRMAELIYPDGLTLYGTFPRFTVSQDSLVDVGVPGREIAGYPTAHRHRV